MGEKLHKEKLEFSSLFKTLFWENLKKHKEMQRRFEDFDSEVKKHYDIGNNYPKVVKVLNDFKVVLNKGHKDGIKEGQRFRLIEKTNEELRDPDTGELFGYLEIPKGEGVVVHATENTSILESDYWEKVPQKPNVLQRLLNIKSFAYRKKPFENPKKGDWVIPIKE